jgi:hypothetical protein
MESLESFRSFAAAAIVAFRTFDSGEQRCSRASQEQRAVSVIQHPPSCWIDCRFQVRFLRSVWGPFDSWSLARIFLSACGSPRARDGKGEQFYFRLVGKRFSYPPMNLNHIGGSDSAKVSSCSCFWRAPPLSQTSVETAATPSR